MNSSVGEAAKNRDVYSSFEPRCFAHALDHWSRIAGDRTSLIAWTRASLSTDNVSLAGALTTLTWRQLKQRVDQTAETRDLTSDNGVWVHTSDNSLEDVISILAAARRGCLEAPLDFRLPTQQHDSRLRRIRRGPIEADVLMWTTGTAGRSKGVRLSRHSLWLNARSKLLAVPQTTDDVRLTVLPLCHAYARTCDLGTWLLSGCTLAVSLGWDGIVDMAPRVRPTLMNVVPLLADRMLDEKPPGLDRLRCLGVGGAALAESSFGAWTRRGVAVIQGYGLTETGPTICSATPQDGRPGSVGKVVQGWETKIVDRQLFVRGDHLMLGYLDDSEHPGELDLASEAGQRPFAMDDEGWFATGDVVRQDEDGQLRIVGRVDDVIVLSNGTKIDPMEIERIVNRIVGVHASLMRLGSRNELELWIDGNFDAPSIRNALASLKSIGTYSIHQFERRLDADVGELTLKGTICRSVIARNRFGVTACGGNAEAT
jgi:long-chain acyl-CoA synthetase